MGKDANALLLRHILVDVKDDSRQLAQIDVASVELHDAVLGFRNVHQGLQHRQHVIGFFQRVGQGIAHPLWICHVTKCHFRAGAQASQRGTQIVGDVIERFAHATHERLIARKHAVEKVGKLIEFVAGAPFSDPQGKIAGVDHLACRSGKALHRTQRPTGEKEASEEPKRHCSDPYRNQSCPQVSDDLLGLFVANRNLEPAPLGERRSRQVPQQTAVQIPHRAHRVGGFVNRHRFRREGQLGI